MPGRLFLTRPLPALCAALDAVPPDPPEEPARANIAPGQSVMVAQSAAAGGVRLVRMRWGLIPVGRVNARGRPVMETIVNARGETVFSKSAYAGVGRALVPVDGWYEWTGRQGRKTPWRIRPVDGAPLTFAAITDTWRAPGGTEIAQVATVTCAPSGDVAHLHDRMGVIVAPEDRALWLDGPPAAAAALCRPWPEGRLHAEEAWDVDFRAP